METKICSKCKIEKFITLFSKDKNRKDGLKIYCNDCRKIESKIYRERNPEKRKETIKKYFEKNKEKELLRFRNYVINNPEKRKDTIKKYYETNKQLINKKQYQINKKRYNEDILFKLKHNLRERIKDYLNQSKTIYSKTFNIVGCTPHKLKEYLESKFTDNMSWGNYGFYGWHIDHIIPLSSAKDEEELKRLCHYTNLQPLWCTDNLSKGCKIL
jgi:hypothetical protein